jgi:hypothetical protein
MEIEMTETVPTTTLEITFEDLLATVFPTTGLLRLVAANGNDSFYRRHADRQWLVLGPERAGLNDFIIASGANVTFSPVAWRAPAIHSPMAACECLWAGIRYGLKSQQPHEPRPRVLDGERERAVVRLAGIERPSVLIDEGDRMVAFWRLTEPVTDPAHVRSLLEKLARHVGGDRELADPMAALVAIPGTRNDNIYPSRMVTLDALELGDAMTATPRHWTAEDIIHATSDGRG